MTVLRPRQMKFTLKLLTFLRYNKLYTIPQFSVVKHQLHICQRTIIGMGKLLDLQTNSNILNEFYHVSYSQQD